MRKFKSKNQSKFDKKSVFLHLDFFTPTTWQKKIHTTINLGSFLGTGRRNRLYLAKVHIMAVRVVEFQTEGTKLERFLPKNQHTLRKLLNFKFWINGELSKSAKIWFWKSIFNVKNHLNLSHFFFIEEYQFRSTLFAIDIF